jgi:hypothetical protein
MDQVVGQALSTFNRIQKTVPLEALGQIMPQRVAAE